MKAARGVRLGAILLVEGPKMGDPPSGIEMEQGFCGAVKQIRRDALERRMR